jgi:hypothetical protein
VSRDLFNGWLETITSAPPGVFLYQERAGQRGTGLRLLKALVADHFVGEATILKAGGYKKAAEVILNSLPTSKRVRSGDLAEVLATEYVNSETPFRVPIKKLRWKSDRQMPMHGNDIIGVDTTANPPKILKGECKSRATFNDSVASEAADTLDAHDGRPNPSSLAFIAKRLYEENRDAEAQVFQKLQSEGSIPARTITHGTFVVAGNDPRGPLERMRKPRHVVIARQRVGVVVSEHAKFIERVFGQYGKRS